MIVPFPWSLFDFDFTKQQVTSIHYQIDYITLLLFIHTHYVNTIISKYAFLEEREKLWF